MSNVSRFSPRLIKRSNDFPAIQRYKQDHVWVWQPVPLQSACPFGFSMS